MDKNKSNKKKNKDIPIPKIEEPDFSNNSHKVPDKKLQAQIERERKDAELMKKQSEHPKKNQNKKMKQNKSDDKQPTRNENNKFIHDNARDSGKNNKTNERSNDYNTQPTARYDRNPRNSSSPVNYKSKQNKSDDKRPIQIENNRSIVDNTRNSGKNNKTFDKRSNDFKREPITDRIPSNSSSSINCRYYLNEGKNDHKFQQFLRSDKKSNGKIREEFGNLFDAPNEYSLAHCVAEDFSMGAGIAKEFKARFKGVAELLNQNAKTGGLAILDKDTRFIYYLVTKRVSQGKPTLHSLWQSLLKLRDHVVKNKVRKLAIPQIGCGLDRLDWHVVKCMVDYIFDQVEIEIVVYILEYNATETPAPSKSLKKCYVVHEVKPLVEIVSQTGLIFLGTEDGSISPEIESLATKYDFVKEYQLKKKSVGDVIKIINRNEYLYGLIARPTYDDPIDFRVFERCLHNLEKQLKTDRTDYIGIQGFVEKYDDIITAKLVNLMQYHLKNVEIWVCWPRELEHLCPYRK